MRICYISVGKFSHVSSYIEHFHRAGHDVHFIALTPGPPQPVPTYNLGLGENYSPSSGKWKYPISMIGARRLVRRLKPDIVHTHYATSGGLAGLACGHHPTIVTVHGTDLTAGIKSAVWRRLLKAVFKQADCVNTVSEDLKAMVISLGIPSGKTAVLCPGIDTARFEFAKRSPSANGVELRLVCTRNLEPVYDPATIVAGLALLKEHGVRFRMTFCGDGSLRGELQARAKGLGLERSVTFLGAVRNAELPAILREHDVYLSASKWDGTSLSLLEAMASGLFPIVSDIKANSAWLRHGTDAFLHTVGSPRSLADCILELTRRPELAAAAAGRNRGLVENSGDRQKNMRRLEQLYLELLAAREKS